MTNCRATFRCAILRLALRLEHVLAATHPCWRPSNGTGRCSIAGESGSRAALDGLRQAHQARALARAAAAARFQVSETERTGSAARTPSNLAFGQNVPINTESAAVQRVVSESAQEVGPDSLGQLSQELAGGVNVL